MKILKNIKKNKKNLFSNFPRIISLICMFSYYYFINFIKVAQEVQKVMIYAFRDSKIGTLNRKIILISLYAHFFRYSNRFITYCT